MFSLIKPLPYTVYRYGKETLVRGVFVRDPTPETFEIEASVQPAKFHEVVQMPEADRTRDWQKIYTKSTLRLKREGEDGYAGDYILYKGNWYEVIKDKDYISIGTLFADHNCYYMARLSLAPDEELPGGAN